MNQRRNSSHRAVTKNMPCLPLSTWCHKLHSFEDSPCFIPFFCPFLLRHCADITTSRDAETFNASMTSPLLLASPEPAAFASALQGLRDAGHRVHEAADGAGALGCLNRHPIALLLLEMSLPGLRGPEVLRRIRRDARLSSLPVIGLGRNSDEIDRVLAFELGADDFVASPVLPRELALRVRAVLRRSNHRKPTTSPSLQVGPFDIDVERHRLRVHGQEISLTAIEFRLLRDLLERAGHVQPRDGLIRRVWPDAHLGQRTVDTHVRRLREKLGDAAEWLETVRGVGYRMRSEPPLTRSQPF